MAGERAIGIGGSAGAIEALRIILGGLPASLAAPVFVVVHVGPGGLNRLADIFDQVSPLSITTAAEGERASPGHAYVAPADRHLIVQDGVIRLGRGPRENMSRPAIDPLFRSLGFSYGSGAIGVLLSGYLNDGAAGIADLKRCGGVTVVQDPKDAEVGDMPVAALRASDIDYRAPAADMADLLVRLLALEPTAGSRRLDDVALETEIALGRPIDAHVMEQIADPTPLTCPSCGGVLSHIRRWPPLRFRCQVGHTFTGEVLASQKDVGVDEAVRVAQRIIEERAVVSEKLAEDARRSGLDRSAERFQSRVDELRGYAEMLRRFSLQERGAPASAKEEEGGAAPAPPSVSPTAAGRTS